MIRFLFVLIVMIVAFCVGLSSQTYTMAKYTNTSGLPQNYIYSLAQDPNGFLWIAMGEGLTRYDGINKVNYSTRDSLSDMYVSSLLIDTDGRLWCGHGNGQLTYWNGSRFKKVYISDVSAPIKDMCTDDRGNIWAVEQNKGLIRVSPKMEVTTFHDRSIFGRKKFNAVKAINSYTLIVGTTDGLMLVKLGVDDSVEEPEMISELEYISIECVEAARDGKHYWIGTEEGQLFSYGITDGAVQVAQCEENCSEGEDFHPTPIRSIYEDEYGKIMVGTWGRGASQWEFSAKHNKYIEVLNLGSENGLGNDFIADIIVDREGIYWFATYGGGVAQWVNNYFSQYNLGEIGYQRMKATQVTVKGDDLWVGLNSGILKINRQCMADFEYYDSSFGLPSSVVSGIVFDEATSTQYVSTESRGVYYKHASSRMYQRLQYESPSNTTDMVNGIVLSDEGVLYIATQGGLIVYDTKSLSSKIYTTESGLPHNNINFVFIDDLSQVWVGPKDSGIAMLECDGNWDIHRLSDVQVNIAAMTIDDNNRKWLASVNNGVLCAMGDSIISLTTSDGLEKNYCYDIAADGEGRIWVCHMPGLSCIDLNTGNIRSFNANNDFGQEFIDSYADEYGDIWFANTDGIIHYTAELDKRNNVPPLINFTKAVVAGTTYNPLEPIELSYPYTRDVDKFEFDFIGICMRDPKNVKYEYWLQMGKHDNAERWMSLGEQSHKEFDFLPEGDYVLNVRAFNSDGTVSEQPLRISIHIDSPFWKSWYFPLAILVFLWFVVRAFMRYREKKLKQRQQELEEEVHRQTAMLQKQKNVIERKNKDIMDGINYANRIQTAILPSKTSLMDYKLGGSFLIFKPRDVVSGDFYWFNQYDNHLLICCGDCTGHGVPGAFMSMIGTTILNDATRNPEKRHPKALLEQLDKEVKQTLNKNQSIEAQDGMDCAIIDINLETRELISAAAHRPIVLFIKGRMSEIRGTRRSVGDRRNGNEFEETVTQLYPGDTIYMFSDGLTDQFNSEGEKYTSGKFKRFLQDIQENNMEEQQSHINAEFEHWKGTHEQVDDVIVMGIKIA